MSTKKIYILASLLIKNFKGISLKEMNFSEDENTILGRNRAGKTTVHEAISWLWTGKTPNDKEFNVKPTDSNNEVIRELETAVEALYYVRSINLETGEMDLEDDLKIRREYVDIYSKREKEYKGDTSNYFWNGTPLKTEGDFMSRVNDIVKSQDVFKMITNPMFFCSTTTKFGWKERREVLEKVAGVDISDEWVLSVNPGLKDIIDKMQKKSMEDIKNEARHNNKRLQKEIDSLNTRIDESRIKKHAPEDLSPVEVLNDRLEKIKTEIDNLESALADEAQLTKRNNDAKMALLSKIHDLQVERSGLVKAIEIDHENAEHDRLKNVNRLKESISETESRIRDGKNYLSNLKSQVLNSEESISERTKRDDATLSELRKKISDLNSQVYDVSAISCYCKDPLCGKKYDETVTNEMQEQASKEFNKKISDQKEEIRKKGISISESLKKEQQASADFIEKSNESINKYEAGINKLSNDLESLKNQLLDEQKKIDTPSEAPTVEYKISINPAIKKVDSEIYDLNIRYKELNNPNAPETIDEIKEKRSALLLDQQNVTSELAKYEFNDSIDKRIKELQESSKKLGEEMSTHDKDIYDCEEYDKIKYNELETKINSRFKYVKFKMFNALKNGGYEPTCIAMFDGIPFTDGGLNTESKYLVGMEIISVLTEFFGVSMPVVIDGRESVSDLPVFGLQVINLVVSKDHKTITVS